MFPAGPVRSAQTSQCFIRYQKCHFWFSSGNWKSHFFASLKLSETYRGCRLQKSLWRWPKHSSACFQKVQIEPGLAQRRSGGLLLSQIHWYKTCWYKSCTCNQLAPFLFKNHVWNLLLFWYWSKHFTCAKKQIGAFSTKDNVTQLIMKVINKGCYTFVTISKVWLFQMVNQFVCDSLPYGSALFLFYYCSDTKMESA